eukprot:CAMPEP_0118638766 /NCGR_PEP_ID=MMETSP0785-20121206/3871_1 /TAXON_ID=91992 /ORGANISM="Bolidomonas pacifica, Strain CCMP 1866" /LENGTH=108 /DNA_ID=CAMNT_0006530061 /DNA_START=147 /DNA_END=469 /DNA_ORIENTATION=+
MNPITSFIHSGMKPPEVLREEQERRVKTNDYNAKMRHNEWNHPTRVDDRPLMAAAKATGAPVNPITANREAYRLASVECHLMGNSNAAIDAVKQGMKDLEVLDLKPGA